MSATTVGTLLADIANRISDGLRIMTFADKRQWGPDEHEQMRLLEEALDDAKKDFQELSQLVNGQIYYENDRKAESLAELRALLHRYDGQAANFRDWVRAGGPINPTWAKDTQDLRRALHLAQCRAAARVFALGREGGGAAAARCLGAFLVHRKQRAWSQRAAAEATDYADRAAEELWTCNGVGRFERFGDRDVAFVCDFCDGHVVWEDLEHMPSQRAAAAAAAGGPASPVSPVSPGGAGPQAPNWQATGRALSGDRLEKTVVFAPVAIANHAPPRGGGFQAPLVCPYCEELAGGAAAATEAGDEDGEDAGVARGVPDEEFADLHDFQDHLAWQHTASSLPSLPVALPSLPAAPSNCCVM